MKSVEDIQRDIAELTDTGDVSIDVATAGMKAWDSYMKDCKRRKVGPSWLAVMAKCYVAMKDAEKNPPAG